MKRIAIAATAVAVLALVAVCIATSAGTLDTGSMILLANAAVPVAITGEDIAKLGKELGAVTEQVKSFAEDVKKKLESGQAISDELKGKIDKAMTDQGLLRDSIGKIEVRATEIEQMVARRKSGGGDLAEDQKTPGQLFLENERVISALKEGSKHRGRVRVDMAAITTAGMANLVEPMRVGGIISLPERRLTVRDLITPGTTASNAVQYWQETGFTNNAQIQTESQTKGESTITGELVTANVATIAHFMVAAKQIMDDAPALQSHIDGRLRYGLAYVEETQLLTGDGDNGNLSGLIPNATAFSAPFTPDMYQRIDTIRVALLQAELALFPSTGIVLNPTDWSRIELTKDGEGRYIFSQPQSETQPRLWGRPVVSTPAMNVGFHLEGAFKLGAQIFDRQEATVEISTEDNDNFRKNLVTIRGEERLALAIYRPEAFIYGAFPNVT